MNFMVLFLLYSTYTCCHPLPTPPPPQKKNNEIFTIEDVFLIPGGDWCGGTTSQNVVLLCVRGGGEASLWRIRPWCGGPRTHAALLLVA